MDANQAPNISCWWAKHIIATLVRRGVGHIVLCPGSRNVPLIWAAHHQENLQTISIVDERSAAFYASGLAKATGQAAAVCVTSGSAVANCLPALCEAFHAHIPLLILSADRPESLHGLGAPQTMEQAHIFKPFCGASIHLPLVQDDIDTATMQLQQAEQHLQHSIQSGLPAHINVPLAEPLAPIPHTDWQDPQYTPAFDLTHASESKLDDPLPQRLPGSKVLCVAGPELVPPELRDVIAASNCPLMADHSAGFNHMVVPKRLTSIDAYAQCLAETDLDLIICLGSVPLARSSYELVEHLGQSTQVWCIGTHSTRKNFVFPYMRTYDLSDNYSALQCLLDQADDSWAHSWYHKERQAQINYQQWRHTTEWNECIAYACIANASQYAHIHYGNSMAIRHANMHPHTAQVTACRGLNGIDGTIAHTLGYHHGTQMPSLVVLGDITAIHDQGSLHVHQLADRNITYVIMDNGGGAIFDLLPVASWGGYQTPVRTPQHIDFSGWAAMHGCDYQHCTAVTDFTAALDAPPDGCRVIHVSCPTDSLAGDWNAFMHALRMGLVEA